jgi:undecaprenyl-diphosphatase
VSSLLLHLTPRIDEAVTEWAIRCWRRSPTLDAAVIVFAQWTPVVMLALIALAGSGFGLAGPDRQTAASTGVAAVTAAVLGRIVNEPVSRAFARPRPFEILGVSPLFGHERGESFPSNHATGAFALAVGMMSVPGYGAVLMTLAVLLCLARVYGGLHHLTDVVAGALHGTLVAVTVRALWP